MGQSIRVKEYQNLTEHRFQTHGNLKAFMFLTTFFGLITLEGLYLSSTVL